MAYPLVQPGRLLLQQHVPMRDGVRLAADVWLPPASFGAGPFPTLVARSQHGTERYLPWVLRFTHESGYACVLQDVRGRGDSDGANPWPAYVTEESDGFDTLRWAHEAPLSSVARSRRESESESESAREKKTRAPASTRARRRAIARGVRDAGEMCRER